MAVAAAFGLDNRIATEKPYARTQAWSVAWHTWYPDLDGVAFLGRKSAPHRNLCLYLDRCAEPRVRDRGDARGAAGRRAAGLLPLPHHTRAVLLSMTTLGPRNGKLLVHTGKGGAIAKAGHNLMIEVGRWRATLTPDAVELTADARSLRVVSGSGGISPLRDEEKAGIAQTIDDDVLKGGTISYRSSAVTARDGGYDVEGHLDLLGVQAPLSFALSLDGDHLTGRAEVKQTDWRIKPYSALFGTLKVADVVEVTIDATLPKEG